ncbi:MAG: hypothetical protein AAB466_00195, partial [Verrucomicrobiota bacterium]
MLFINRRQPCFCPNAPSPTVDPPDLAQNVVPRPSRRPLSPETGRLGGRARHWHAKTLFSTVEKADFAQNPPARPSLRRLFPVEYSNSPSFASIPVQNAWKEPVLLAALRVLRLYQAVPFVTQLRITNHQSPWRKQLEPRNTRTTRKQNGLEKKMESPNGRTRFSIQLLFLSRIGRVSRFELPDLGSPIRFPKSSIVNPLNPQLTTNLWLTTPSPQISIDSSPWPKTW